MPSTLTPSEESQLWQTIEMFKVITQSQPQDYQSLEILKEAYFKLGQQKEVVLTSKRIAEAYVQLGQLSSAIMEYETILHRFPEDPDVQKALAEIENKTNSFATRPSAPEPPPLMAPVEGGRIPKFSVPRSTAVTEIDDGWQVMQKLFVDGKLINATDFGKCWATPTTDEPTQPLEPFIQALQDKGVLPLEKSMKLLCEKSRLGFLPLEKYDVDVELARSFPKSICLRWCLLPFDRMSKSVLVATANPFNKTAANELQRSTPHRLIWYLASPPELIKGLKKVFRT